METKLVSAIVEEAEKWLGVWETSPNKGPEVEMFQRSIDGKAEKESWCMCFVQYCVQRVAMATGTEVQIFPSEHCLTVWQKTPANVRRTEPEAGSVVIWRHGDTTNGHTGIVTRVIDDEHFETIEGNTGPGAGVERNGDGVYRKVRHSHPVGEMQIVGYLIPLLPRPVNDLDGEISV